MEYSDQLFSWISSQDPTFSRRYTPDSFKSKLESDSGYRNELYGWISRRDPSFAEKYTPEVFTQKVTNTAPPINEPEKKKAGLTGMESSSEDGSLGFTEQKILPEYLTKQPEQQVPYQFGMEPDSYFGKSEQDKIDQAQQQKEIELQLKEQGEAGLQAMKPEDIIASTEPAMQQPQDGMNQLQREIADKSLKYEVETARMVAPAQEQMDKKIKEEEEARRLANQLAAQDPELSSAMQGITSETLSGTEESIVPEMNKRFGKYGLFFEESGFGTDYMVVSTTDGKKRMEIRLGAPSSKWGDSKQEMDSRAKQLQEFIYSNATPTEAMDDDFIANSLKAKKLRKTGMANEDGSVSTVKFAYGESDGKFVVYPTLFPAKSAYTSKPQDWLDLESDPDAAWEEAKKRGEIFTFKTKEDAERFADGEWKDVDESYLIGKKFYEERGLDYVTERRKFERFNSVQDEIDIIENIIDKGAENIPIADRSKFPEYFGPDGRPLYYSGSNYLPDRLKQLSGERDLLLEQVYDNEFMYDGPIQRARELLDVELEKKRSETIKEAVNTNLEAKKKYDELDSHFQSVFNMPVSDIAKVSVKTPEEARVVDSAKRALENITFTKENAAMKFEEAKTYLDAKWNKELTGDYIENWEGLKTALGDALERGQASEEILLAALGIEDITDKSNREAVAKAIADRFAGLSGKSSLAQTRYDLGRGGSGWKAFYSDPLEFMATVASTSFTQMLPYGVKVVPATVATGAAAGAAAGLAGGPLAPATSTAGAITGGSYGLATGMAAASFGMEYSNAIFDVMREKGYDLTDPKQVEAALLNDEVWSEGGDRGLRRGIPIALVDFFSKGVAGRVFSVAKTAALPVRIGAQVAERALFDPAMEAVGEFSAQVMAGQDIDKGEIAMEALGGFGNNTSNMGMMLWRESINRTAQSHAYTLATDMNAMAKESTSDERITTWANNLKQLGKIDEDVAQRINENVGLRREARDVLKPVAGVLGNKKVEARVMELIAANKEMTSTQNRRLAFKDKISQVNTELAQIAETGKLVPADQQAQIEMFNAPTQKAGVSHYNINGKTMTRQQFLDQISKMDRKRLLRSRVNVMNDDKTKQQYNAILEQKTGRVPVREQAGTSEALAEGRPQAEPEVVTDEGVTEEEVTVGTDQASEDLVSSKTRMEELNASIPQPAPKWSSSFAKGIEQGTLAEDQAEAAFSFIAERLATGAKLSPQQVTVYEANKEKVDGIKQLVTERNDLSMEIEGLEGILGSQGQNENVEETSADAPQADFQIAEAVDEEGEIDFAAEEEVRAIAKKRDLGITSDREIAFVARDNDGNIIGGAFRSFDPQEKKYTFDVVVSEESEGKGVGSMLLDAVGEIPSDIREESPKAKVEVDVVNPAMQKMLRKRGYVVKKKLGGDRVVMVPRKKRVKVEPSVQPTEQAESPASRAILSQAKKALSVLRSIMPEVVIVVHDTQKAYGAMVSTLNGDPYSAGNFSRGKTQDGKETFRIDINLSKANSTTVAHEVAHALMYKAFGDKPELFRAFRSKLTSLLQSEKVEELDAFAALYSETDSHVEFLAQLAAVLSENQSKISQSVTQKIANAINAVISKFTMGKWVPFKEAATTAQVVDFMNTFVVTMGDAKEAIESEQAQGTTAEQVVSLSQKTLTLQMMQDIIRVGRENGFSDAAIRHVLRDRGFTLAAIDAEMVVNVQPNSILPAAFANVDGGVKEGLRLFRRAQHNLAAWVAAQSKTPTAIQTRAKAIEVLKSDPIFRTQTDTVKMELIQAFDSSMSSQVGVTIQRMMDNMTNNLRQRKLGKKELQLAKIKLKNIISQMLPGVDVVTAKRVEKIMELVANATEATILKDMGALVKMIDAERKRMRTDAVKKLNDLVTKKAKVAKTKSGKRRSTGLDEVGQAFFAVARDVLGSLLDDRSVYDEYVSNVEQAQLDGTLNDVLMKQQSGQELTSKEETLLNSMVVIDLFADFDIAEVEEVNDLIKVLSAMRSESIKQLKVKRTERSIEYENIQKKAEEQVKALAPVLFDEKGSVKTKNQRIQDQAKIRDSFSRLKVFDGIKKLYARWDFQRGTGVKEFFRNMLAHLGTITNSMDNIAKGKTFFTDHIYKPLNMAKERALRGYYKQMTMLDSLANTIPGVTKGYKQIQDMLRTGEKRIVINGKEEIHNADKLLRIYALSLNDVQNEKLANMGWGKDEIAKIKELVGPEAIAFADLLVEYLSTSYFDSVNDVYKFVNNVSLGYINNYFPTKTESTNVTGSMITDGDFNGVFSAENAPSLKERTNVKGVIELTYDFTDVVEDHFRAMEKYKALAWEVKKIDSIFRNEAVKAFIQELRIEGVLKQSIMYAINPDAGGKTPSTRLSQLMIKYTGYALAFKVMQVPKQAVSSFVNAYEDYSYFPKDSKVPGIIKGPVDLLMFIADSAVVIATIPKWLNLAYKESATYRERWDKGVDGDVYGLTGGGKVFTPISKSGTRYGKTRRFIRRASGMPTMVGDVLGVMGYMVNFRRNRLNGMPMQTAIDVFNDYNATAQSRRETEKNSIQRSDHDLIRVFTMFASTVYLQQNKVYQSMSNISKSIAARKMPRRKDMRALALNLGISNALFIATSNIFKLMSGSKDDEKEVLQKIQDSMLGAELVYQVPLFGSAIETAVNYARDEKGRPVSDIVNPMLPVWNKIKKGIDDESIFKATQPILEMAIGTQIDPAIGLYNAFNDGFSEEAMYDIIGVSPSYRPSKSTKTEKKEDGEMNKEDMKKYFPDKYNDIYLDPSYLDAQKEVNAIKKEIEDMKRQAMDDAFGY